MTTTSALPKIMKAAVVDAAGPPKAIHMKDVPVPSLAHNHVIIALEYAGVGGSDAAQRAGQDGPVKPGTILGSDGSGRIAAVGSGVEIFNGAIACTRTATATRLEASMPNTSAFQLTG